MKYLLANSRHSLPTLQLMHPRSLTLILAAVLSAINLNANAIRIVPGAPPLSVIVSGKAEINGRAVAVSPTTLPVAPPGYADKTETLAAPGNHQPYWDNWLPWPRPNKKKNQAGALTFAPAKDENGVLMLGLPYRQYPVEHIVIQSADGQKTFVDGRDYKVLEDTGQVANLNGALGDPAIDRVRVSYREVEQRLDIVQVDANGKASIKQGQSRLVCPYLPEADSGQVAVAGIYVAPWLDPDSKLTGDLIFPITDHPPVQPVNPGAVAKTRAKLEAGKPVSIAYMGDSLTLGAEAGLWWQDDTQHWRGRFQNTLKERYPDAEISEIAAWKGGRGVDFGVQQLKETVLPAKPDLLIIMMGINDADGPSDGSKAKVPPAQYGDHMENMVKVARDNGIEVILMTSMQPYPMKPGGHAERWAEYASIQRDIAEKHGVGLADTYQEWLNLEHRGMPPYSQLHNWNNHPGSFGHGVMADVPLRFFPGL